MLFRSLTAAVLSATFLISIPTPEARAGNAGKIIGGLAAGAAAGFIAHKVYKNRQRKKRARRYYNNRRYYNQRRTYQQRRYTTPRSAFNQNTLDAQTRLNALGYNAGSPDGLMGSRTRNAIRQFQAANGFPATGALTVAQTALLVQLHQASLNPRPNNQVVSTQPQLVPQVVQPQLVQPVQPQVVAPVLQPVQPQLVQPVQPQVVQPQLVQPVQPQVPALQPVKPATAPLITVSTPTPTAPSVAPAQPAAPAPGGTYATMESRPGILGIKAGGNFAEAAPTMTREGFANCEAFPSAMFCEKATSFGSDKIAVAASGGKIHTVTRKLTFNQPKTRDQLFNLMPPAYAALVNAPQNTVASSPACNSLVNSNGNMFDGMVKQSMVGSQFDAASMGFSHACNYYFSINVPQGQSANEIELTFFDSSAILASAGTTVTAPANGEIKF